jgi:hypothetical protein
MTVLGLDNKPKVIERLGHADYLFEAERLIELRWGKIRKKKRGAQKLKYKNLLVPKGSFLGTAHAACGLHG